MAKRAKFDRVHMTLNMETDKDIIKHLDNIPDGEASSYLRQLVRDDMEKEAKRAD